MIQQALKQATATEHNELESLMYVKELMQGTLTQEQYMHLVFTNYTVHALAEKKIFDTLHIATCDALQLNKREKLSALTKDMDSLGLDTTKKCTALPQFEINGEAAALGALYVLEGATLGGQVILKMLYKNNLLNHLHSAFNYYNVYSSAVGENWKAFCSVINKLPAGALDEAIAGSKNMYAFIKTVHTKIAATARVAG